MARTALFAPASPYQLNFAWQLSSVQTSLGKKKFWRHWPLLACAVSSNKDISSMRQRDADSCCHHDNPVTTTLAGICKLELSLPWFHHIELHHSQIMPMNTVVPGFRMLEMLSSTLQVRHVIIILMNQKSATFHFGKGHLEGQGQKETTVGSQQNIILSRSAEYHIIKIKQDVFIQAHGSISISFRSCSKMPLILVL